MMGPPAETIVTGRGLLEGPVWRPATGDLVVTVVGAGRLLRVDPASGSAEPFADTAGGPNGAFPCTDGGVLVAQNGGLDWDAIGIPNPDPSTATTPGIQRVDPDGAVTLLTASEGPFRAPNDLVATDDGTVLFTDPPQFPRPAEPSGRIWRWERCGRPELVTDGLNYPNGIGVEEDDGIVIVEDSGLMRIGADGRRRDWLVETLPHGGDGFAFDVEGNIYVCGQMAVTVVSPDGEVLDILRSPDEETMMTNCCFGGDDLRTLYSTDGRSGRVLAFAGMPVPGRRLTAFGSSVG